jgi:rubredoxin
VPLWPKGRHIQLRLIQSPRKTATLKQNDAQNARFWSLAGTSGSNHQKLVVISQVKLTTPPYVGGMTLIPEASPCPRCGGKLEFKDTVESPKTGARAHFFRCDNCGYIHAVKG